MDPRTITKMLIVKRLAESLPADRVEKNLPAIEKTADRIMGDIDQVIGLLVGAQADSLAPKQCHIRGLAS